MADAREQSAEQRAALAEAIARLLEALLPALEAAIFVARHLHPQDLPTLVGGIGEHATPLRERLAALESETWPPRLDGVRGQLATAAAATVALLTGLRAAADRGDGVLAAYRALRQLPRAEEALYPLAPLFRPVSQYFVEPARRADEALLASLEAAGRGAPDRGVIHFGNEPKMRGGFSFYAPEDRDRGAARPLIMALHGGGGHGRGFLWSWLAAARTRGCILVAPTSREATWSLTEPELDDGNLRHILDVVAARWRIDPARMLLTGMSDGGTFTYLSGLSASSPFTHLAPIAASFHPMLLAFLDGRRIASVPIYLVHGALDWMFPVTMAREAAAAFEAHGAALLYREVADLSHTYPRDENAAILDWFLGE